MNSKIRIGDVLFELPVGSSVGGVSPQGDVPPQAGKPEAPESLDETPYIYRPNDPFQSAVDEARAIASISPAQKPWVIKTWFVLFVLGPLFYAQIFALAMAQNKYGWASFKAILTMNLVILPLWTIYYLIWRRRMKKAALPKKTIALVALVCIGAVIAVLDDKSVPVVADDRDTAVLVELRQAGSDFSKLHSIDFFLYFPTEAAAQSTAKRLVSMDFQVSLSPPQSEIPQWQVVASRRMLPEADELAYLRSELNALSKAQGGEYDGWETAIVR